MPQSRTVAVGFADGGEHAANLSVQLVAEGLIAELEAGLNQRSVLFNRKSWALPRRCRGSSFRAR